MKESGLKADTVYDEGINGKPDSKVFSVCLNEKRVLITLDLDFSDIRLYPPNTHFGIIIFRLTSQSKQKIIFKLQQIIPIIKTELLEGCIWIVDEKKDSDSGRA